VCTTSRHLYYINPPGSFNRDAGNLSDFRDPVGGAPLPPNWVHFGSDENPGSFAGEGEPGRVSAGSGQEGSEELTHRSLKTAGFSTEHC
jgi:hypothetical protein